MINRLNIARLLVISGFVVGTTSLLATFGHIGNPAYLAQTDFDGGQGHTWYHALREAFGDAGVPQRTGLRKYSPPPLLPGLQVPGRGRPARVSRC